MKSGITAVFFILIVTAVILSLPGCSGDSRDQEYIDFAHTVSEEYLVSINEKDYQAFSRHLGKEMMDELPEDSFLEFADQLEGVLGKYIEGSREFSGLEKQSGFISVIYNTEYTDEPGVVIFTLVLQKVEGEIKISGSWFNSPKLRGE
jgi:hypothetical protein